MPLFEIGWWQSGRVELPSRMHCEDIIDMTPRPFRRATVH